ncbi:MULTISPECIES: membrane protein insertase YidC [unclassified Cryobacterium]|uniref:YidC/Oxa1 family membrane protein insertase n=1 Tax=unclassified Cryobacterium TaxID=2649013 RepID=UPI00106B54D6|nr:MULTISPECIES: membrane protein insertase YidC [unclassified Cryobacterium]TFB98438.1 membrane protein insertase YidC [Cryobacterium sp. MDB2-A-1]TFC08320.1 membrane protein insertase YidC [Cryobacterium sp. MDB2-33-2]TFC08587.1 membrane protein insertase YidC [Cryobacterium sp. MDB2-A-2]TFC15121.1 membrane protein insertase YidC [Cryobacterium sp. MDB2-10]TFC35883.1 membrane protein insertase YidC [Cryobacterium sp. MDB1-18-2]
MDLYSVAPVAALLQAASAAVTTFSSALAPISGASSTALVIVLVTLLLRAVLVPVGRAQVRAEFVRRRLAPKLRELQRRYRADPELLNRRTAELYAAEKASPLAGCLPTLLQAPIVSTVYALFVLASINGQPNPLLAQELGGVPLGTSFLALLGTTPVFWPGLMLFGALLAVIALTAGLSRRLAARYVSPVVPTARPAAARLAATLSWLPFLTLVFASVVPLAATLYLTVSTAWTLVERGILYRSFAPTGPGS